MPIWSTICKAHINTHTHIYIYIYINFISLPLGYKENGERAAHICVTREMRTVVHHIYMFFVVVDFDALAQASDFQIKIRRFVFVCWMQDLNQGLWNRISIRLNARWQTYWAIEDQAENSTAPQQHVPMTSEHSNHSTPLPQRIGTWYKYACFGSATTEPGCPYYKVDWGLLLIKVTYISWFHIWWALDSRISVHWILVLDRMFSNRGDA